MIDRLTIDGRLALVDEVLSQDECVEVTRQIEALTFKDVEVDSEFSIWRRNAPLNPQVGPTIMWPESEEHRQIVSALPGVEVYPTGTPFDGILDAAKATARALGLLSSHEASFAGVIASVYRYPAGSRLVWHNDDAYLGAFSAYLSQQWSADEGGQFAFMEGPEGVDVGVARIVEPRPNRLVVFGAGVRHSILPVASDAKQPRIALSGFFVRRTHAERLLAKFMVDISRRPS